MTPVQPEFQEITTNENFINSHEKGESEHNWTFIGIIVFSAFFIGLLIGVIFMLGVWKMMKPPKKMNLENNYSEMSTLPYGAVPKYEEESDILENPIFKPKPPLGSGVRRNNTFSAMPRISEHENEMDFLTLKPLRKRSKEFEI